MLGEFSAGERLADAVIADVGEPAQAVEQAERLQDAGVNADADISVSGFNPLQCRPGREGALGHDGHRQPSAPTGIVDVRAELAHGAPHGSRRVMWGRHFDTFALQIDRICSTKITIFPDPNKTPSEVQFYRRHVGRRVIRTSAVAARVAFNSVRNITSREDCYGSVDLQLQLSKLV